MQLGAKTEIVTSINPIKLVRLWVKNFNFNEKFIINQNSGPEDLSLRLI